MQDDSVRVVLQAARRAAQAADAPLLLAVSGGLDSMALLAAMATVARPRIAAVATFDHGTGPAARHASAHVVQVAESLGLRVVAGHAPAAERTRNGGRGGGGREATWRRERHDFLRDAARPLGARIVVAHTEDDQIETVLMRLMRGSGARGLAGLLAPNGPLRPFLGVRRATLAEYLGTTGHRWVEDPSNASREFLRNRLRHDLLPALRGVQPSIDDVLLETGRRAAAWRVALEQLVDDTIPFHLYPEGGVDVASAELASYDRDSLAVLWSAIAGRAGLALDRRGTQRLATFTISGRASGAVPLSAGWRVEARRGVYQLRREGAHGMAPAALPDEGTIEWGAFRFRVAGEMSDDEGWNAALPAGVVPTVRAWGAGDRLEAAGGQPRRRVKRYLSDAGLRGSDRAGWPVVVAGQDVVWIPGVRRSDAATARSGGPVRHYVCERIDR
jgi:tRNA(Ile)-lysidine synthase